MKNIRKRVILALTFCLVLAGRTFAQQFKYSSIDVKCSANPAAKCPDGIAHGAMALQTVPMGINASGNIVGSYVDAVGNTHGFLLSHGRFKTLDVPGVLAGVDGALPTSPSGINPAGDIVGFYVAPYRPGVSDVAPQNSPIYCPGSGSFACWKGFLYKRGEFSTVLFPDHPGAVAWHITADGDIYGCRHDFDLMNSMVGAAWTQSGDFSLTANGGELNDPSISKPNSMNNGATPGGQLIVGKWTDSMMKTHGFKVTSGVFHSYDFCQSCLLTAIWDVSPNEEFVGTYVDSAGHRFGFAQFLGGLSVTLEFPGAAATIAWGVNPEGAIVGQYVEDGVTHGFLAVP